VDLAFGGGGVDMAAEGVEHWIANNGGGGVGGGVRSVSGGKIWLSTKGC
jgi:hypothetical protein